MNLGHYCEETSARLDELRGSILSTDPTRIETCERELKTIVDALTARVALPALIVSQDRLALKGLQRTVRRLRDQLDHAANLCQGWAQLCIGTGYNPHGQPVLADLESKASYEG